MFYSILVEKELLYKDAENVIMRKEKILNLDYVKALAKMDGEELTPDVKPSTNYKAKSGASLV